MRTDLGKVESGWDEDVDFNLSPICPPPRKAAIKYPMRRIASSRSLEEIAIIRLYNPFFYLLRYVLRGKTEHFCGNDNVNVLGYREF
jgi:hypothetical protein